MRKLTEMLDRSSIVGLGCFNGGTKPSEMVMGAICSDLGGPAISAFRPLFIVPEAA